MSLFKSKPAHTTVGGTESGMANLIKTAKVSLEKGGLAGQRAAVYLVLDRSGSMRPFYLDGSVQRLAEQALGLSTNLDDDGTVPVVFFGSWSFTPIPVSLNDYQGCIDREHKRLGALGSTNYAAAIREVVQHYQASRTSDPAFVIFQTDGRPDSQSEAEQAIRDASRLPLFWVFVGFGDEASSEFDFLRKLDTMNGRVVDNAAFFAAGRNPQGMSDAGLYTKLLAEFPQWLTASRAAGVR